MPESPDQATPATAPATRLPGERLMRSGAVITVIGMLFSLIALYPLISSRELPSWLWWASMSTGIGLAMVLIGLTRAANARRAELHRMNESSPE